MLDPEVLKTFVAVADHGSFTQAAKAINCTQSAVSMQIKRLEEIVGAPVLLRQGKRVCLSPRGVVLIGYARRILSLGDEALGAIGTRATAGSLRLGCTDDYATRVLPAILASFWHANPDLQIEVKTDVSPRLLGRLGIDYDLVLAMHPFGSGRGEVVCREQPIWACSGNHAVAQRVPVPLALYHSDGCLFQRWARLFLDEQRRPWRYAYLSPSMATIEAAVQEGLAISIFKQSTMSPTLRQLPPELGFPRLPEVEIVLYLPAGGVARPTLKLAEHLFEALRRRIRPAAPEWSPQNRSWIGRRQNFAGTD
jgi:DNA-binding transcriptional LysR family regulator